MSDFNREDRYFVFKRSDVPASAIPVLESLRETADYMRGMKGKPPLVCVVVESDWPEYEKVWQMIEDRVTGKPSLYAQMAAGMGRTHSGDD
jgi:O6-methylguanine-DNA--protein-cysteine methyltransferase